MCGRGLIVTALELSKTYVVDDQEKRSAPAFHSSLVRAIGEASVQVVNQVYAVWDSE
jgi:hypothetical protein